MDEGSSSLTLDTITPWTVAEEFRNQHRFEPKQSKGLFVFNQLF
jgi:hypothetical protein